MNTHKKKKKRPSLAAKKLNLSLKIILPASLQEQLHRNSARGFLTQKATEQSLDVIEAVYFYLVEVFFFFFASRLLSQEGFSSVSIRFLCRSFRSSTWECEILLV